MGSDQTSNVGIEGEMSLKEFDLIRFLRDPFLRGFELYSLEGLLCGRKFKLFLKSASKRSFLVLKGISKG
jgi:hypothetical protein